MRTTIQTIVVLLIAAALGHAMGCNPHGDLAMRERLPRIEISPSDLCNGLAAGCSHEFLASTANRLGTVIKEITIFNPGEGPLELQDLRLAWNSAGAYSLELPDDLATAMAAQEPYLVSPLSEMNPEYSQQVTIRVRYTPVEEAHNPASRLIIENNSTNKTTVRINFSVRKSPPKIQISPEIVDFGKVNLDDHAERTVNVLNIGDEPLTIDQLELTGNADFMVSVGGQEFTSGGGALQAPMVLPPNTISGLEVRFVPTSANPAEGSLLIYSDDPGVAGASPVLLLGNQTAPCISVHPQQIDFGVAQVASETIRPLEIMACGGAPLTLTEVSLSEDSSDAFNLVGDVPGAESTMVIPIGDSVIVNVVYVPGMESPTDVNGTPVPDLGTVIVESDALLGAVDVPLSGVGVVDPCPTAVIQVAEGTEVDVQTVLHLYGDQSYATAGTITKWEWTIEQPLGSQSVPVPSTGFPNPTFEANVAGLYRFNLTVWDENNIPSCQPAMTEVAVISKEAIHIELLWNTPEDPDETDEGPEAGSDLDLHFVHPWAGGPDIDGDGQPDGWFDQPFDCFWFNAHPEWASFDPAVDDDPGLDRDDTDGAGPENINLNMPEDLLYRIGVHYWNDHDYGASYATVRIYIYSQLVFEVSDVKLMPCDMWEVATLEWPSGKVKLVTELNGAQYKITPGYTNPFFDSQCN